MRFRNKWAIVLLGSGCLGAAVIPHGNNGHGNNGGPVLHTNQDSPLALLAQDKDASIYGVHETIGTLAEGILIPLISNVVILPGDPIIDGIFWAPYGMWIESGCDPILDFNYDSMVIEFMEPADGSPELTVTCQDGFYACCSCFCGNIYALCRANNLPDPVIPCIGGGPGSTECGISRAACGDDNIPLPQQ